MQYQLGLCAVLSGFWLLNSPNDNGLLLFLGVLSVLLVMLLTHRMKLLDRESLPLHLLIKIGPFYLWLLKEIVLGSLYVLKHIVMRDKDLAPREVVLELDFKDELTEVIFANSVTLVPGTLSVELSGNTIRMHALTQELADDLMDCDLIDKLRRLEQ